MPALCSHHRTLYRRSITGTAKMKKSGVLAGDRTTPRRKKAPAQPTADRGRSGLDGGFLLQIDHCAMVFTDTPRSIGVERP